MGRYPAKLVTNNSIFILFNISLFILLDQSQTITSAHWKRGQNSITQRNLVGMPEN